MPRRVHRRWLGRVPYASTVELQHRLREDLRRGRGEEHLLLLEHPHVYTLGRNADAGDLLTEPRALEALGVEVHEANRGGQVTYHGPGQLVGYPILNLSPDRRDVRRYVRDLQETLIRTLADFGLEGRRREGQDFIGVWVGDAKVASIGVHLSRWLTTHGFALNVSTDLAYFRGIVACGLPEVQMASIESLTGERPSLEQVADTYGERFAEVFDRRLVAGSLDPLAAEAR